MTWLLAQIGLSLLLAALAGWFVGWYLRAFRDQDRVEDLRQTMLATKDVKERELNELRRQVEDLEARALRASDGSARVITADGTAQADATVLRVADRAAEPAQGTPGSALVAVPPPPSDPDVASRGHGEDAVARDAERERRREAEAALRRKTAAILTFQAEIEALREAVAEKAAKVTELQDRLVGTEPTSRQLAATHEESLRMEARLKTMEHERATALAASAALDADLLESRKELVIRDTRINDLRNRCASLESEIAELREKAPHRGTVDAGRVDSGLEEARRALQRQIERNRKQETVHRAVVAQLEGDKARLRATVSQSAPTPDPQAPEAVPSSVRRGLPQRTTDELTQLSGVGPAFAAGMRRAGIETFAQIAAWSDEDVERYAGLLGAHASRIQRDRWVEQARDLARDSALSDD